MTFKGRQINLDLWKAVKALGELNKGEIIKQCLQQLLKGVPSPGTAGSEGCLQPSLHCVPPMVSNFMLFSYEEGEFPPPLPLPVCWGALSSGHLHARSLHVPAPPGCATEHHGSFHDIHTSVLLLLALPAWGLWGTLRTGVLGVKLTSSGAGCWRGPGGVVKLHASTELLKEEVQQQLCDIEVGSVATPVELIHSPLEEKLG